MRAIHILQERCVVLPLNNVDTDQIIPARFLKGTVRDGLGAKLFADWRYDPEGKPRPDFILNQPAARDARVLIAGDNFGCGSSREHAPWALLDFGFQAVVSTSFADIFRGNSLKNGLLPIVVDSETHHQFSSNSGCEVTINLETCTIIRPDGAAISFPIDAFARHCLMNGVDELTHLLGQEEAIATYERRLP